MTRLHIVISWAFAVLALTFGAATLWVQLSDCPYRPLPALQERFRPNLLAINSVDAAMTYLPVYYPSPRPTDLQKVEAVNEFVQDRFFHGLSTYRPCDNWLAGLSGSIWSDLAAPVLPDDILKYRRAFCSQQAIVAEAMLHRLGIHYASVTFAGPGHFAPAARVGNTWYFFDPDTERQGLVPLAALTRGEALKRIYPAPLGEELSRAAAAGRMRVRDVDTFPGPRGAAFDLVTGFLSRFGWALFAALFLLVNVDRARFRRPQRGGRPQPLAAAE